MSDRTAKERQARYRARTYQIAVKLGDPEAIRALAQLWERHGSQRAAIEHALRVAAKYASGQRSGVLPGQQQLPGLD